ncbi:MAG: phosphate/phosphite/phosphonate ABC transporter substrate-binding protein [Candidatus Omnitrophica bacterium]|nr:phosphate/phosphite/phosphonate ABC transporter substrate-binding protein [Candidatus Omnitrophota bacterium]
MYKFLLISVILFCLTACEKKEIKEIKIFQPEEEKKISIQERSIKVGIAAVLSPKDGFIYYKELLDYLSEKMSYPIVIKYGHYKEINECLKSGELDIAFVCSGAYIEGNKKFKLQLLVSPVVNNKTTYHSYIIVHKESSISNFDQLKGKSFAFTDPLSNSGYLFPVFYLAKKGKTPQQFFYKTIFTYSHDNSIIAVAEKLIDGAAVDSLVYDWMKQTKPDLIARTKIILSSPPFGIPPVVVPYKIDSSFRENLQNFFLNLHKEEKGRQILSKLKIDKFIKPDDRIYDSIRIMKTKVEQIGSSLK